MTEKKTQKRLQEATVATGKGVRVLFFSSLKTRLNTGTQATCLRDEQTNEGTGVTANYILYPFSFSLYKPVYKI